MESSNMFNSTAAEKHTKCLGTMCCLSFLYKMSEIPFHGETLSEVIMSHMYPDGLTSVKEEPESDINIVCTSIICHRGNESQKSESTIFICNYASWLKLQSLVQILSPRWYVLFGCARLHLFPRKECTSAVWHLDRFSPKTIQESKQGQDYIWFSIPTEHRHKFGWLATQKLRLFRRRTVCKETFQEFLCGSQSPSSRNLEMVFDKEEDVLFLSGAGSYTNWTSDLIANYVNEVIPVSSCSFCSNSRTYSPDGSDDVFTSIDTKFNATMDDDSSFTSYLQQLEAQDFEVNHIKVETPKSSKEIEEHEDMTSRQRRYCNFRLFLMKYTAHAKKRGYHLVTTEPMLIVQCPGCSAEFRGLTNRMLRLIDHIKVHGPKLSEQFMNDIQRRYGVLINLMKTRMLK